MNQEFETNVDKKVVVVGAGLAGLSAAYELLKNDRSIKVTIVEALGRVGGRVYTPVVDGIPVDVGGYMIFLFYRELRSLLKEFGLLKNLRPISSREFYRFSGGSWVSDTSISILKIIPIKLIIKILRTTRFGKTSYYEPNLDLFPGLSVYDLFLSIGVGKDTIEIYETLVKAYTYPPSRKYPPHFSYPLD